MATYVMSDLHGELERFETMLESIRISSSDRLYILGDVVDRGEKSIPLLRKIMRMKNVLLLLGNHEHMLLRYFAPDATETERRRWNRNCNFHTLAGLDGLSEAECGKVMQYLATLPDHLDISVSGRNFHLVHGCPGGTTEERIWGRPTADSRLVLPGDATAVIGHTPVVEYLCPDNEEEQYVLSHRLSAEGDFFHIFYGSGFINIDCCCGYGFSAARLACLRLDDMAEFYV